MKIIPFVTGLLVMLIDVSLLLLKQLCSRHENVGFSLDPDSSEIFDCPTRPDPDPQAPNPRVSQSRNTIASLRDAGHGGPMLVKNEPNSTESLSFSLCQHSIRSNGVHVDAAFLLVPGVNVHDFGETGAK